MVKLNWKNTFILGLGFFGISMVWTVYNQYMPILYEKFIASKQTIGWIMTIDNILALTLQPYIGYLSDHTRTRFGRRIPFLLVGAPAAAVFLFLIPFGWATHVGLLLTATIFMNLAMSLWRSPIIALMPDVTPAELRSQANGIINFMGGLGTAAAMFGGAAMYRLYPGYPFVAVGILLLAVATAFYFWIREPASAMEESQQFRLAMVTEPSTLWMLAAIFFMFIGYNSVDTWITTYGKEHLHMAPDSVGMLMIYVSAAFMVMAIPAGFVAGGYRQMKGLGRKWTIILGLLLMMTAFGLLGRLTNLNVGAPYLAMAGVAWALVNINTYPTITQMAPLGQIGAYTGLYYLFQNIASVAAPPFFGFVFDNFGYDWFFPLAMLFLGLAGLCMLGVKKGEATPTR